MLVRGFRRTYKRRGFSYTKKRFQANYSCSADQNTFAKKYIRLYPHRPVAFIEMNSIYYQQVQ